MSGPIIIETGSYSGPERRGILMAESTERRQTNEVAIARLEVNVEYIKQAVDEIKQQSCRDCVTANNLKAHLEDHKIHANTKWDRTKYLITTGIAVLALLITIIRMLPKSDAPRVSTAAYSVTREIE